MLTRRSFLPLLAAPAVLKLGVYMPVSSAKLVVMPLPANPVFTSTGAVARYEVGASGPWLAVYNGMIYVQDYVSPFGAIKVPLERFSLSSSHSSAPSDAST